MSPPPIHTYHCLCSTLLLATPYPLPSLPRRAAPSLDRAYILPLPPLTTAHNPPTNENPTPSRNTVANTPSDENPEPTVLPSLLTPSLRPARKMVIVRREDGFEKRKVWRCGRCGVGVGYEVLGGEGGGETEKEGRMEGERGRGRVIYLLEGGLMSTEEMGRDEGLGG